MSKLNISTNIVAFGDADSAVTQPQLKFFDWTTSVNGVSVEQPRSKEYMLDPGETRTIFSGTRTLALDNTSQFSIALNSAKPGVYRVSHVGGTAPVFRTARNLTLTGLLLTCTVNNNATMEFTLDPASGSTFAGVQVGDTVFIPHTTTGDAASVLNVLNVGFWTVLAIGANGIGANRKLTCRRPGSQAFVGVTESATLTSNAQFQAYSSGPVQIGDFLALSAGFSAVSQKTFQITEVTPTWVEFASAEPLPLEVGIVPTTAGFRIYSEAQTWIRVMVDQEAVVRKNGDPGDYNKMAPREPGEIDGMAHHDHWGPCWDLVVVNKSPTAPMRVIVLSAKAA